MIHVNIYFNCRTKNNKITIDFNCRTKNNKININFNCRTKNNKINIYISIVDQEIKKIVIICEKQTPDASLFNMCK